MELLYWVQQAPCQSKHSQMCRDVRGEVHLLDLWDWWGVAWKVSTFACQINACTHAAQASDLITSNTSTSTEMSVVCMDLWLWGLSSSPCGWHTCSLPLCYNWQQCGKKQTGECLTKQILTSSCGNFCVSSMLIFFFFFSVPSFALGHDS